MTDRATRDEVPGSSEQGSASYDAHLSPATVALESSAVEEVAASGERAAARIVERGASIGRYLVLSLIGRGGMGAVYAAYDPELDRKVALKLLHATRGSAGARKRLVREARALGRLSHPNVVQVHDVGEHEGDVFVAMELIEGQSLDAWCRSAPRPSTHEVLAAYLDAAKGLHAAHEKGLVHRDVKPSNILRGNDGRVRVVDFGLAGAHEDAGADDEQVRSDPRGLAEARLTAADAFVGTPLYMAPEQHQHPAGSPAADQYSLCVALWEGLYGAPPFDVPRGASLAELRAALLDRKKAGPPASPPAGAKAPAWLHAALARGLAVEPNDRYPSLPALVAALSDDPDARRQTRRRRAAIAVLAAALCAIGAAGWVKGGGFSKPCEHPEQDLAGVWDEGIRGRVRTAFQGTGRPYAEDTAARVAALLDRYAGEWTAMRGEVCQASHAGRQPGELLGLRDACLERRRAQLQALTSLFAEKPDTQVLDKAVTAAAGLHPIAYCADTEALTAPVRPPEDPALRARAAEIQRRIDRIEALFFAGKYKEGLALATPLLDEAKAVPYAPIRAQAAYWLGRLRELGTGEYDEAKALLRDAAVWAGEGGDDKLAASALLQILVIAGDEQRHFEEASVVRSLGPTVVARARDDRIQANWLNAQGLVLYRMGKNAEALSIHERALALREKALGPDHPAVASSLSMMGLSLHALGDLPRALSMHERALAIKEKAQGPDHPDVALMLNNLANVLGVMGDFSRAQSVHERALAIREKALGPDHPTVAQSLNNIGFVLIPMGDFARARAVHERALAIREKALGPDHPLVAQSVNNIGKALLLLGDYPRALALQERSLALREKALGPDHRDVAESAADLGNVLFAMGDYAKAVPMHERARRIWEKALGPDHADLAYALAALGRDQVQMGHPETALPLLERALQIREKAQGPTHPDLAEPLLGLGEAHLARREPEQATPLLERALALHGAEHAAEVELTLAEALLRIGKDLSRARELAEHARATYERAGHRPGLERAERWLAERSREGGVSPRAAQASPP